MIKIKHNKLHIYAKHESIKKNEKTLKINPKALIFKFNYPS